MGYEYAGIVYERQGEMLVARRRHYVELVLAGMGLRGCRSCQKLSLTLSSSMRSRINIDLAEAAGKKMLASLELAERRMRRSIAA